MSEENLKQLKEDAKKTDGNTLMRYIRVFSELSNQLRYASQKRVLVEVALIKLTRPSMEPNLDSILQRLGELEAAVEDLEAGAIYAKRRYASPRLGMLPAMQVCRERSRNMAAIRCRQQAAGVPSGNASGSSRRLSRQTGKSSTGPAGGSKAGPQ